MRKAMRALWLWVRTVFRAAPLLFAVDACLTALSAVAMPLQALGVKLMVDGLADPASGTLARGIALAGAGLAMLLVNVAVGFNLQTSLHDKTDVVLQRDLLGIVTGIPGVAHHEDPKQADRIALIGEHSKEMAQSGGYLLMTILNVFQAASVAVLLASVHPLLVLLPALGLARMWASAAVIRMVAGVRERVAPADRLVRELQDITVSSRNALETRTFGLKQVLLDRIDQLSQFRYGEHMKAGRRMLRLELPVRVALGLAFGLAVLWTIWLARNGRSTIGDIALVVMLVPQVEGVAGRVAMNVRRVGEIVEHFGRYVELRDYARSSTWAEGTVAVPDRLRSGIELRDVSFRYPGADRAALAGVNLFLPAGSTVALVGENGAGKTTLVKLLSRLYDPSGGAVLVDGVDLRSLPVSAWRARLAAGFQDFMKYEFLARETVGVGDLERLDDEPAVLAAVSRGDADDVVDRLPAGLATQLGTRFADGRELSGGQWQRLALARAFMRDEPLLLLLDEPTAALDPEAEHALFSRITEASRAAVSRTGGVTLLVSHRFSTVRMADLIVVLADGRVAEIGTHSDLLALDGRYADLFRVQARAYR
ncbi:ABC transporter ATP-binding protein [Flindersiella endophytica]